MAVWVQQAETRRILLYEISSASFRLLPPLPEGWIASEPAFSNDQTGIAVGAECRTGCDDPNDLTRLMIFDLAVGGWRTVVSGKGFRGVPTFLPGDKTLIYVRGRLRKLRNGYAPIYPEPATASVETVIPLAGARFYLLSDPQPGPGPSVFFIGIGPRHPSLKEKVRLQGKQAGDFSALPYHAPVTPDFRKPASEHLPEIIEDIAKATGQDGVLRLKVSGDGRRIVFLTGVQAGGGRLQERIYVREDGIIRTVVTTDINVKRLELSKDGLTALVLGDPARAGRRAGYWRAVQNDAPEGAGAS